MKLASFGPAGEERPGIVAGDWIVPIRGHGSLDDIVGNWPTRAAEISALAANTADRKPLASIRLGSPLRRPGKIIGVGANYRGGDGSIPDLPADPILFFKPYASIVGPTDPVVLPYEAAKVVGEPELVVVIGRSGHRIAETDAIAHVMGYCVANDVTAPEIMLGESARSPLFFQQGRGKGFPTFCPLGPWITTVDEAGDPYALNLEMTLEGDVLLSGAAALMIHSIAKLVSAASHAFGLEAGDILLTGSPRPASPAGRRPLAEGDVMVSRIEGLGELRNPIVAELPPEGWDGLRASPSAPHY